MRTDRQLDDRISRWLEAEAPMQLPDRVLPATFERTRRTRQQGGWRTILGRLLLNRLILALGGAAAVLVVAVMARGLYANQPNVGGQPTPTATPTPTLTASPSPIADPEGRLTAGTYVAHPFGPQEASLTFSVPSDSWEALRDHPGRTLGILWAGDSGGVGVVFLDVTSLNGDPCNWSGTEDDVDVGQTVDDLVSALAAETEYAMSEPEDATVSGYTGKKVVLTMPADLRPGGNEQPGCDEQSYFIWNTEEFNIYAQGPENLWTLWILDVEGERVVIQRTEFADSNPERVQELDSIVDSIVISPAP